jgi:uncharacterized membrane protein
MLQTLFQVGALVLTAESAFFLARGNLVLSPKVIAQISGTYWGYNRHLVDSLASQAADTWVGVCLLISALGLQLAALWRGPQIRDLGPANRRGVAFAIAAGILVLFVAWFGSQALSERFAEEAQAELRAAGHRPAPELNAPPD